MAAGTCPVCDGTYRLAQDGTLRSHKRTTRMRGRQAGEWRLVRERCSGSGLPPRR